MVEEIKSKGEALDVECEKAEEKNINNYETTNVHKAITKISSLMLKVYGSIAFESVYKKIFNKGTLIENYLEDSKHQFFIFGLCTISYYDEIAFILKD